jgi:hypothetical protein
MIPDREPMENVLIATEEMMSGQGWDEPPLLALVLRMPPPPGMAEAFGVVPYVVQPGDLAEAPVQALLYLGAKLRQEDAPESLPASWRRRLAGVTFAGEGWAADPETYQPDGPRFADIPGSREVRFVHLLDCAGRYFHMTRFRGSEPEKPWVMEPDDPGAGESVRMSGNVVIGLRDFLLGISKRLPPDAIKRDVIAAIAREDEP